MIITNEILGAVSIILAALSLIPYFISVLSGRTRPHMFSWAIWTVLTAIAFMVQWTSGAGPGAWATAFSAVGCLAILIAAFWHGERHITRSDWATFIAALLAIPIWLLTENAALAAIWVTVIDGLGFYPTFRKSWFKPHEEMVSSHAISMVKHVFSILALNQIFIATAFYPAALIGLNFALVTMIIFRRRYLRNV